MKLQIFSQQHGSQNVVGFLPYHFIPVITDLLKIGLKIFIQGTVGASILLLT